MAINAVAVWDFTLAKRETTSMQIIEVINKIAKKWTFQLEKGGENGLEHWQGKMSLKVKKRLTTLKNILPWDWIHLSPTSKENILKWDYVTKEDTRIAGPYTSEETNKIIPWDVKLMIELRPWQNSIVELSKIRELRKVNIIYDPIGGIGKTSIIRYCMVFELGQILPFANDYRDLLRIVCDVGPKPAYFIDMPRAISKDKLNQLYSAIETIKGGYAYDDRYHFRQIIFDPPVVFVFSNSIPELGFLSADRWAVWQVKDENLISYGN